MSSFNANPLGRSIQLSYRSAPTEVYVDPLAEKLGTAATVFAVLALVVYGAMDFAASPNLLLLFSIGLAIIGSVCAVGAVLDRHIPAFAWLAAACLAVYWMMAASAGVKALITICTTIPLS